MRNANRTIALIIAAAAALGACNKASTDQNVAMANNAAAPADIEALPADESSTTPSNELATGDDAPDTNDLNESGNAY